MALVIRKTKVFSDWIDGLKDVRARARVQARIERLSQGLYGDSKAVGKGVYELRVDYGPGYRVYYIKEGNVCIILLAGGDKRTQRQDILIAQRLARNL